MTVQTTQTPAAAEATAHRLDVPGGTLHYEVRGSGPLLLVIGQPMTSEPFGPLADLLAEDHTVVTYDPHGLGRSTIDDASLDVTPDLQADDLSRLVDAVGGGRADVFASSGGAITALAFATRHPDQAGTVVAHEPPVTELLPDAAYVRAAVDGVVDAYRAGGSGAGWGKFVSLVVHHGLVAESGVPDVTWPPPAADANDDGQDAPSGSETPGDQHESTDQTPPPPSPKQQADDELFFLRMLKPFTRYEPVVEKLRTGAPRVLIAVGAASDQELARRSAVALADRLGTTPVTFPGDHGGFMSDPVGFAETLRQVLQSN